MLTLMGTFSSCSTKKVESVNKEQRMANNEQKEIKKVETNEKKVDLSTKKIVIIKQLDAKGLNAAINKIKTHSLKEGVKEENITNITNLPFEVPKIQEVIDEINKANPNLIYLIPGIPGPLKESLKKLNIPIVASNAELDCDENGVPKGNVTGLRSSPPDFFSQLFSLLDKVIPIKGKKAAAILNEREINITSPERIKNGLEKNGLKLAEATIVKNKEEALAAAKKYSEDDKIGYVFIGNPAETNIKGEKIDVDQEINEIATLIKKPTTAMNEKYVARGILCGISFDDVGVYGEHFMKIGDKILNGAKVSEIKMEDITEMNIIFNKKTADDLKIKIPDNLFNTAYRVYTDYNFSYVGNKK